MILQCLCQLLRLLASIAGCMCAVRQRVGMLKRNVGTGITSGTPPTAVDTTMSPAAAASTMAMQKASVSDALMKMSPLTCVTVTLQCHAQLQGHVQ